jgi:hypothetical protein
MPPPGPPPPPYPFLGPPGPPGPPVQPGPPPPGMPAGGQNHYYYYMPAPQPQLARNDDVNRKAKIDTRKPEAFTGKDRRKWKPFVTECLMTFFAKPVTYRGDHERISFAASYLTETAQSHYTSLLQHNPHHPALQTWADFIREFGGMFRIANMQVKAEQNLRQLQMTERDHFANHIVQFESYAFESQWNFAALQSELYRSLPIRIKEAMKVIPRPATYQELRNLTMQIDQRFWEFEAEMRQTFPRTPFLPRAAADPPTPCPTPNTCNSNADRTPSRNPNPRTNPNAPARKK